MGGKAMVRTVYAILFWTLMLLLWIGSLIGCTKKQYRHEPKDSRKHGRHYL